uniref:17-beta-hydroxysteroid dehydrogenase type 6 n=1 Tax=Phallusia mammillata TaxID=59560 RepID=A0A6F9DE41_9ASCI|nr:17-beta-hydroxysteroid dehydrogenase type 6 [Phallusia mammillata]
MAKSQAKPVVITGCDVPNSYGYELALRLDHQGYAVFAGCADCNSIGARSLASRGTTNLAILQIDVTKQDEIDDATEMINDMIGDDGLWAVVNCAESYTVAEVDWCAMEDFDEIMQVNFLGTVRVTKSLLHLIRKARGRVINLSSMAGCVSRAGQAAYSSSKFAIEAFSDSLRQEMLKWGVFVSLVEPAFFPEGNAVLSDSETSTRLQRVPKHIKDAYGDEYFTEYIHSVSGTLKRTPSDDPSNPLLPGSQSSTLTSGYSSMKSDSSMKHRSPQEKKIAGGKSPTSSLKDPKRQSLTSLPSSATSTLKSQGSPNLSNTNRVLHALMEAVTSPSPKVRYFVGSFQDRVVKSFSSLLPTVVMDTYLTSGEVSKVVPKLIKEKTE